MSSVVTPSWATGSSWTGWIPGPVRIGDSPGAPSWMYRQASNNAGLYIDGSGNLFIGLAEAPTNYGSPSSALTAANTYASANGGWGTTPSTPTLSNPCDMLSPYVMGFATSQMTTQW